MIGDRYTALPQLRIQLHGNLSDQRGDRRKHQAGCLWSLPLDPLVLPSRITQMYAVAPMTELALLARLVAAGVRAAILGWEREASHKPAGLRTHMLVGIASQRFERDN
jgi:hypothetical protein